MEHLALYRKWRPQNFKTILGQGDTVKVLKNAVVHNRVVHAYLFCGTRGTGKTSTARILAKALNCEDPHDGEPCNECENCRAITEGSFMDVIEIDAASNRGIDEARELLEKVHFVPVRGRYKVYIIDEAHMLTNEAFNALLKTFEEPPPHVVFILATTEARKVPLTIISRCQRYDFKPIDDATMIDALKAIAKAEQVEADENAVALLAQKAKGSMRDALSLMDQAMTAGKRLTEAELDRLTGAVAYAFWPGFFRAIADNDLVGVFRAIDGIADDGKDLRQFFRDFRDRVGDLIAAIPGDREDQYAKILRECADIFTPEQILTMITVCGESELIFRYNRDAKAVCRFLTARIMRELFPTAPPIAAAPAEPRPIATVPPTKEAPTVPQATSDAPEEPPLPEAPPDDGLSAPPPDIAADSGDDVPLFDDVPPLPTDMVPPEAIGDDLPGNAPMEDAPATDISETSVPTEDAPKADAPVDDAPEAADAGPGISGVLPDLFGSDDLAADGATDATAEATPPEREDDGATMDAGERQLFWAKVLREVKKANHTTATWLIPGELKAVYEDRIVVAYAPGDEMYLNKAKEPEHTAIVEQVLAELCDRPLKFTAKSAAKNMTDIGSF